MDDPLVYTVPSSVCTGAWLAGLRALLDESPGDTPFHMVLCGDDGHTQLVTGVSVTVDERLANRLMAWREGAMA